MENDNQKFVYNSRTSTPDKSMQNYPVIIIDDNDRIFNQFKINLEKKPEKLHLIGVRKAIPNITSGNLRMNEEE